MFRILFTLICFVSILHASEVINSLEFDQLNARHLTVSVAQSYSNKNDSNFDLEKQSNPSKTFFSNIRKNVNEGFNYIGKKVTIFSLNALPHVVCLGVAGGGALMIWDFYNSDVSISDTCKQLDHNNHLKYNYECGGRQFEAIAGGFFGVLGVIAEGIVCRNYKSNS